MQNQNMLWRNASKTELAGILTGITRFSDNSVTKSLDDFQIGSLSSKPHLPSLVIVSSFKFKEILSWIDTYATECFPISHSARLLSQEDWEKVLHAQVSELEPQLNNTTWSSIVLGELLGQAGKMEGLLDSIPFSRTPASFSHAVARTNLLYGNSFVAEECIKRLYYLEQDFRFVKRKLSVTQLLPLWNIALNGPGAFPEQSKLPIFLSGLLEDEGFGKNSENASDLKRLWSNVLIELANNSAEARVLAFEKYVNELLSLSNRGVQYPIELYIATAAFLVGQGTSHVGLLARHAILLPSCYAWFGLLAGICGPNYWDNKWARVVKLIDRQLGRSFCAADPVEADLCWVEYGWLANAFERAGIFNPLLKQHDGVLTVEVLPGAVCQMRLENPKERISESDISRLEFQKDTQELSELLMDLQFLSSVIQEKIQSRPEKRGLEQRSLFENPGGSGASKSYSERRKKRPKT